MPAAAPPERLAEFEIVRRLGAGGMAEVFLARKRGAEGTHKILVVKRILPQHVASRRFRAMFVEEAQLATRLNHPNIVQVYEFQDYGDDGLLLSMEYVEGPDLGRLMSAAKAKATRIPPWVGAYIVSEVAKGLHYAHERREGGTPLAIVHRDVSPHNVLLSFEGAVKIGDFGIATASLFREETGVIKGKFAYMSPEQARGEKVDRRSDVYSLGVILYEMLTGRPVHGSLVGEDLLEAVRAGVVEPPSTFAREVPAEIETIAMRALSPRADDRFHTARDMGGAIVRAIVQRQEIVDAAAVEATIGQLVGREHTSPGVSEPSAVADASVAFPPISPREAPPAAEAEAPPVAESGRPDRRDAKGPRPSREVRHVAVSTLRLHGAGDLEAAAGVAAASQALDGIRQTLDDIAYKRGARWTWEARDVARAIVGLLSNPARAPSDAAWLAIDVHEALAGASADLPSELRASIGIVRGIAAGERDEAGHLVRHELAPPAPTLAEVVGASTPVGATYVAGGLYRLVRRDFRWGDAPTVDLPSDPGHPMPRSMRIYALERPLTREERAAEGAVGASDLVGRDVEKGDLHAAFHRAVSGTGGAGELVGRVVAGEMGIGKTALVNAFVSELPPDGRVVRVECSPARSELPFGAAAELVRDAAGIGPEHGFDQAAALVETALGPFSGGDADAAIATRLAELATGVQRRGADEEDLAYRRRLVVTGVRKLLAALAMRRPLVVVVDGLQWADRPSLELLSELVHRREEVPILAVLVTRPDERVAPFLEKLVRIELRGLSADELVRLVEARFGVREGVRDVCADLVARAAGNPFFLIETVDALLERGFLEIRERPDGAHALAAVERPGVRAPPLPSTLEQLVGDRLRELPPVEHAVVEWLAIASGPLDVGDVIVLARLPDDEPIVRLCARGLCDRKGDALDLRHPIARDVAYLALEHAERARMHLRLGEHLARGPLGRGMTAAIVARHLARGGAPEGAAEYYLEAAAAARTGYQTQLAMRYYRRALGLLPPDDGRRLLAHEALEAIYRMLGRRRERRKHLGELRAMARAAGHPRWAALALVRTARLDLDEGFFARGLPFAQKAEAAARATRMPSVEVEAQSIQSELLRELGDIQGALAACDRALATAANPEVPHRLRAEVLRSRGVLLRRVGRVEEAVDSYVEAIAVFRKAGARRQEARAKNSLAMAMFVMGRYEDAIAVALESIGIDLGIGGRFQIAKTLTNIGQSYARLGDVPRGLAYLKRARDAHERYGDQDARADTLLVSAEVLLEAGDADAAHVFCGDAGALNAVTGSAYDSVHEKIVRALLARTGGDPGTAVVQAFDARQAAESQALVSFHLYSTAIEAAARVDIGETHTGILLATNAAGAVETTQGTEYGLEIRALCCDALARAGSPLADLARERAAAHARRTADGIRDGRLRALYARRAIVARALGLPPGADNSENAG